MTDKLEGVADAPSFPEDDEISLLDLALVLVAQKKLILGLPAVVAVLAIAYSLLLPNIYTASTRIMPPQQGQSSASAMLAQLGGLAGLAGGAAGLKNPNDLYIGMMKSRSVADGLILRFNLNKHYEQKLQSGTRKALEANTVIAAGKDGIISIEFSDKDPKKAAEIANAYVDELFKLTRVLAVTEASQRRLFFEKQTIQAKDNLARAETVARQGIEKGGLANIDVQSRAILETTARLRGQMAVKEVQIGAMRSFAAERNPDLLMALQELEAMKRELAKIEGSGRTVDSAPGNGSGMDNIQLLRDVKYFETMYEMLAKQYELAKIDEAKDSAIIQVMDKAIEPDLKSKPKRSLIVLLATLAAGFAAVLWAFVREALAKARQNPEQAGKLAQLSSALSWRR